MNDQPSYRLIAAAVILIAYFAVAGLILNLIIGTTVPDGKWSQIVVIFNAVGALATTAAGVLFGAEIQQANVNHAQRKSEAHAVETANKELAMRQALEALEPGAAAEASEATSRARAILQRSLSERRPD